jgi:hypothetical protein
MKNLKILTKILKLANINLIRQNQFKIKNLDNDKKYYSTHNMNKKLEEKEKTKDKRKRNVSIPLSVLDLDTNIKCDFTSIREASRKLGIPKSTLIDRCSKNTSFVFNNRYQFKLKDDIIKDNNLNNLALVVYISKDLNIIPYCENINLNLVKIIDTSSEENKLLNYFMKLIEKKKK